MNYFLDTEFHEYANKGVNTIELISIGIVCEDGREFYAESTDYDLRAALDNEWLRANVLSNLWNRQRDKTPFNAWTRDGGTGGLMNEKEIASAIVRFVGDDKNPQFYGYYCDYDWVVFCWLYGRMVDLPEHFPQYCRDLQQSVDEAVDWANHSLFIPDTPAYTLEDFKCQDGYPPDPIDEHNALADARWIKSLYDFISELNEERELDA